MSTRTDWGIFKPDGTPVAVGDAWHTYECPKRHWQTDTMEHPITGEPYQLEPYQTACPWVPEGIKEDRCATCGLVFLYP